MIKIPTTRKLSNKKLSAAIDREGNPVLKIFPDEEFYQIPRYPDIYISQYARIIHTYKDSASRLMYPYYDANTGYTTITLMNKQKKRVCYGLHQLVALVWLEKPNYTIPYNKRVPFWSNLEVHHIKKVKKNLKVQSIDINWAENLRYVYNKYHKIVDNIRNIKIKTAAGKWKSVTSVEEAAEYYNLSPLIIYELLFRSPAQKDDKWEYYISDDIKIGIKKCKDKSNKGEYKT